MIKNGKHAGIMCKKRKIELFIKLILIVLLTLLIFSAKNINNMFAYFTSTASLTNQFSIEAEYTVTFNSNTENPTTQTQTISYNVATALTQNTFTRSGYNFIGWNTLANGTGTSYTNGQSVTNIGDTTLYAQWQIADTTKAARIGNTYYDTLQDAIDDAPTDNTETTIVLLKNVCEALQVYTKQNIIFDFQNYTLTNDDENAIIVNAGKIQISNGTLQTTAESVSAINNNKDGNIKISGGTMTSTTRQVIYNNGGTVEITGNANLSSTSTVRAPVQNQSGTMKITGGTIVSTQYYGVDNRTSSLTIGVKDGVPNKDLLTIQGKTNGLYTTGNFKFYDGTIKGITAAISNEAKITELEKLCKIERNTENIDGSTYKTVYIAKTYVAQIGNTKYYTLQEAVDAVPNNTQTTIELIHDDAENITVPSGKNIVFDLQTYTLTTLNSTAPVIKNNGNIEIISGTITSSGTAASIDCKAGTLKVSGGNLITTETRQPIYIFKDATVEITGNAYLSSTANGLTSNNIERGTVVGEAGSNLIITGGTIVCSNQHAVSSLGNVRIGTKDGNINATSPILKGNDFGVKITGTFKFYDGIIKGKTDSISATITEMETNSQRVDSTETIGGETYITTHLAAQQ